MSAASKMLEIPAVRDRVSPVTVDQYHQFPEFNENGRRAELRRGLVIKSAPKFPFHASISKLLYDAFLFLACFIQVGCKEDRADLSIRLRQESYERWLTKQHPFLASLPKAAIIDCDFTTIHDGGRVSPPSHARPRRGRCESPAS